MNIEPSTIGQSKLRTVTLTFEVVATELQASQAGHEASVAASKAIHQVAIDNQGGAHDMVVGPVKYEVADADPIAADADLLEAAKDVLTSGLLHPDSTSAEALRAAIARAEGAR